jgi:hypothetical protein
MVLLGIPLLIIPFAIYNIVALGLGQPDAIWTTEAASIPMTSGQVWTLTWEDIIIGGSLVLLWVEVIKSTRAVIRAIVDHVLSMILFVAMLVEFLLVKAAGTSTFFLLLVIALVDVLAGFIISIRTGTRQVEVDNGARI